MRIRLRTAIEMPSVTRDEIAKRLVFALARFAPRIARVDVHLSDINGPRGGVDRQCRIIVRLARTGSQAIVVDNRDAQLEAAVGRGAERAARTVARTLKAWNDGDHRVAPRRDVA